MQHSRATVFDNGPFETSPGISELQSSSLNTFGFGFQCALDNIIAQNFTLIEDTLLDSINLYGYQTGSSTTSTFTEARVHIFEGANPNTPTASIWGDLSTNVLSSSSFTGVFRVLTGSLGATNRPIMQLVVGVNVLLPAGSYWIEYCTGGSGSFSGPWANTVSILNTFPVPGANAYQSISGSSYSLLSDGGNAVALPFVLDGAAAIARTE
jgi:hypothetical protein